MGTDDAEPEFRPSGRWAGRWVTAKMDDECAAAAKSLAEDLAEHIAVATGDAVTIRVVSPDGYGLDPVAANHPAAAYTQAMATIMDRHLRLDEGLWGTVFAQSAPVQWHLPDGATPDGATDEQADFIRTYRVRALLAAPVEHDGRPVGAIGLARFVSLRPFDEDETKLISDCGDRLAPVLALYRAAVGRGGNPDSPRLSNMPRAPTT